jgi:Asparaginase, N-terminal
VKRIKTVVDRKEADGIVITHGTDTMEETAFFLDVVLDTQIPIVLVGSMRPWTAVGSDGPADLYEAVKVAAAPETRGRGVLVVLSDTIHGARWVQKTDTTSLDSIRSPAGVITGNRRFEETPDFLFMGLRVWRESAVSRSGGQFEERAMSYGAAAAIGGCDHASERAGGVPGGVDAGIHRHPLGLIVAR